MTSRIKYVKGNILNSANNSNKRILIHSCNCNGSWGGGLAYQLALNYPKSEIEYIEICDLFGKAQENNPLLGKFAIIPSFTDPNLLIGCLFNSTLGGLHHGSKESILLNTEVALNKLLAFVFNDTDTEELDSVDLKLNNFMVECYGLQPSSTESSSKYDLSQFQLEMPKINSGIFGVPWEETELILEKLKYNVEFTVYEL
ncbi:related to ADP-ribose 1''-phosphate phosphatase [Saccharomycodes ludwigii]|uniref:ADP-ribose 1''-phosphate phosphatase n=1 Tax=Saccharomycodes ludwigii TaxID=36035 RepID=A0A376BAL2_9ASCO|nr:related to ADP-ribose 1''-phosphate phosphatase [Saccharomycodes ludwigii]